MEESFAKRWRWTPEEDDVLRSNYGKLGPNDPEWDRLLPGRTPQAIQMHAYRIGERRRTPWSLEEDAKIMRCYEEHGAAWAGWRKLLPGRSHSAIAARAQRLGVLSQRNWSVAQTRVVVEHLFAMARETGRTPRSCVRRALAVIDTIDASEGDGK